MYPRSIVPFRSLVLYAPSSTEVDDEGLLREDLADRVEVFRVAGLEPGIRYARELAASPRELVLLRGDWAPLMTRGIARRFGVATGVPAASFRRTHFFYADPTIFSNFVEANRDRKVRSSTERACRDRDVRAAELLLEAIEEGGRVR